MAKGNIRVEGSFLGPDTLEKIRKGELTGQRPADFGLEARQNLSDEIGTVFDEASKLWGLHLSRMERSPNMSARVNRTHWVAPFLSLLGYELRTGPEGTTEFRVSDFAEAGEAAAPIHIVGPTQDLGKVDAAGHPRVAPHSLVQEYLNRTEAVWGIATNGHEIRLLRDCPYIKRQAYIEFDLAAIFDGKAWQDFELLYRLLHRSRLPSKGDAASSLVETYFQYSKEQGDRIRDDLRKGVEECLRKLANGFLRHPLSGDLVERLDEKNPSAGYNAERFYQEMLRIVYRLLFLLVCEERGLISDNGLYAEHYSITRLRRKVDEREAWNGYEDLWQSLRVLWNAFGNEDLAVLLGLPPLNGDLFSPQFLDSQHIDNENLLDAMADLVYYRDKSGFVKRVNYGELDVEELGSIYESLLEFHPSVAPKAGRLEFEFLAGTERKETGSYYTPESLVNELIESALRPVVADRLARSPKNAEAAILSIRVIDPACGSGHFLLAAARYLGRELAKYRLGTEAPTREELRGAMRDVVAHCIYGVDRNPLAVDLCRVGLWIESHTLGKPLTFLDHRIRLGDALIGLFNLDMLRNGIPQKAYEPLEGDDKAFAREAGRLNRDESAPDKSLFGIDWQGSLATVTQELRAVDAVADDSPAQIQAKKQRFERARRDPNFIRLEQACHLFTAAFFQPLDGTAKVITSGILAAHLEGRQFPEQVATAEALSHSLRFFHWPLEFPDVFERGGFDVVLSNPPWENVELKEQEFFAPFDAEIRFAKTQAERTRLIRSLPERDLLLWKQFVQELRRYDATRSFLGKSKRYPLSGFGRINTYAVFAELCRDALNDYGRAGIITPTGIATDDNTKTLFGDFMQTRTLASLYDFENRKGIFPGVHKSYKFCLVTLAGRKSFVDRDPEFVFFALSTEDLKRPEKRFTLSLKDLELLNPNTGNCPIFRTRADAELTKAIYRRIPILWREGTKERPEENPWRLKFSQGLFNMAGDSHHFKTKDWFEKHGYRLNGNIYSNAYDRYLPLYEAKMIHQFDHRWATYDGDKVRDVTPEEKQNPNFVVQPRYWVREDVVNSTIPRYPAILAAAYDARHEPSINRILALWAAGYHLHHDNRAEADRWLYRAVSYGKFLKEVEKLLEDQPDELTAFQLQEDFPIDENDVTEIENDEDCLHVAEHLLLQNLPEIFTGWRNIARSTDERTTIASAIPRTAVGHSLLMWFTPVRPAKNMCLLACLNSFCFDYIARQKIGGMNYTFNIFRQLPVPEPNGFQIGNLTVQSSVRWLYARCIALSSTTSEVAAAPYCEFTAFNIDKRNRARRELDAAFFHIYLPSEPDGNWGRFERESQVEYEQLIKCFPRPIDAVRHILDQFPIVREKDEKANNGHFKLRDDIVETYLAQLESQFQ